MISQTVWLERCCILVWVKQKVECSIFEIDFCDVISSLGNSVLVWRGGEGILMWKKQCPGPTVWVFCVVI